MSRPLPTHSNSTENRAPSAERPFSRVLATVLALGLLALLAAPSLAAGDDARDLAMAPPADVGMKADKLQELDAMFQKMVDDGQLAGIVAMVARHGKTVFSEAYGLQDLESKTPMKKDSIFRIYSMSKPITGVALMTLYDQGKFQLSDPVEKYIPEFKGLMVAKEDGPNGQPVVEPPNHKITIRELVSHTGGLTYGLFSQSQVDKLYVAADVLDRDSTLHDMVKKLSKIPLWKQPGAAWQYSVSADVQGYLVEVLSGMPFDKYLEEKIFKPLGMKDTGFYVKEPSWGRLAALYVPGSDGKLMPQEDDFLHNPALFSGGGGLLSTASDYLRFCQMLLNGGELDGVRILEPETVELMHTNQLPDNIEQINPYIGNPGNTFGIDFALVTRPDGTADSKLAKGEFWWFGIGGTWFGINPNQDLIIVGMIQLRGGRAARDVRLNSKKLAYEALADPVM